MNIVCKTIETPMYKYLYDRNTNAIVKLNEEEYEFFSNLERNGIFDKESPILKKMQSKGICNESTLEKIEHPETTLLNDNLKTRVEKITLQVTQNCNLRCSYCVYSGSYENQRVHTNKVMSSETMKKSIDFLMKHSKDLEEVDIGLYGGEPLLHKKLLEECFAYVKENYGDKKVHYNITTNGTIMDDDIIKFFQENNISILISLDGPEEIQNMNRVRVDGSGSFKLVMKNLKYIKITYPELFKNIRFNTVVGTEVDYELIIDFFETNEVLKDSDYSINLINDIGVKEGVKYSEKYYIKNDIEFLKALLWGLGKIDSKYVSKSYFTSIAKIKDIYKILSRMEKMPAKHHHGGPCIPGARRLFIDVNGNFYPCERVSENSDAMLIGGIDSGFNLEKAKEILNVGKLTESECKKCWCFFFCKMCAAWADSDKGLSKEVKLASCNRIKKMTYFDFKMMCLLNEYGFNFKEVDYA